jgi:ribosomal subunit interface protein
MKGGSMVVSFTARHGSIPDSVRRHTEDRLQRLSRFERRPAHAHIYYEAAGPRQRAEAHITVAGGGNFIAAGEADSLRAAVDIALERAERQLKRERERYREHQAPRPQLK